MIGSRFRWSANSRRFLFECVALLVDHRPLGLNLPVEFDVFFAALCVGLDEFSRRVDNLLIIGFNEPILFGLAIGTLTRKVG